MVLTLRLVLLRRLLFWVLLAVGLLQYLAQGWRRRRLLRQLRRLER